MGNNSRRSFLKKAGLAAGSFYIVPRHVLGKGYKAPSDKLNIMGIGAGGKGQSDIMNSFNKGKENIVALVDVDDRRAVQSRKDFPKANYYRDFRKALEAEGDNVDAVIVSTPDHTHTTIAMEAMRRKKHVYVQKPFTPPIHDAGRTTLFTGRYAVFGRLFCVPLCVVYLGQSARDRSHTGRHPLGARLGAPHGCLGTWERTHHQRGASTASNRRC